MKWTFLFKDVQYKGKPLSFKVKYRDHYCYKCRSILSITELGRTIHRDDKDAILYDFPTEAVSRYQREPIEECTFFRNAFLCPKCDHTIEIPTQISLEDTDIYISRLQKRLSKKGHNIIITKFFEITTGDILKVFKKIEDIKYLVLVTYKDNSELLVYKSHILQRDDEERAHYFQIDKFELSQMLNTTIIQNTVVNIINSNLSEYLHENSVSCSANNNILKFIINIKNYTLEINYNTSDKMYRLKLKNNTSKGLQKEALLTMSRNYATDLKALLKDKALSRKSFENHVTGLVLIMKKYLARTGDLRFLQEAYCSDLNVDGIFI